MNNSNYTLAYINKILGGRKERILQKVKIYLYQNFKYQVLKKRNQITFVKNRADYGAGTRGSHLGVDALEVAANNAGSSLIYSYPSVEIGGKDRSCYTRPTLKHAKYANEILNQCELLKQELISVYNQKKNEALPIILSGDHAYATGTIAGITTAHPHHRLAMVWIDAHGDLHTPYTTPTGNVHGMSLAASLGIDNKECASNKLDEETTTMWQKFKSITPHTARIAPADIFYFGLRDTEPCEDRLISTHQIQTHSVEALAVDIDNCMKKAIDSLSQYDAVYISLDVDSMDPDIVSYGTGTPVKNGLTPAQVQTIVTLLAKHTNIICLEIVEINPTLDNRQNTMAETAFGILEAFVKEVSG